MNDLKNIWIKRIVLFSIISVSSTHLIASNDTLISEFIPVIEAYLNDGETDKIIHLSKQESFNISVSTMSCGQKGRLSHLIGLAYYLENRESEAIPNFKQALEYWEGCSGVTLEAKSNTVFNIGICYQYTSTPFKGKTFIDSALALIHKIKDYPVEDEIAKYHAAGSFFSEIKDFVRAETYLKRALKKSSTFDKMEAFYIYIDYTALLIEFKQFHKAKTTIELVDSLYFTSSYNIEKLDKAIFYLNAAEVYYYHLDLSKAKKYTQLAIENLSEDEPEYMANANEILGVVFSDEKDFQKSKYHHEIAHKLRMENDDILQAHFSSIYSMENMAEIALLEGNLDLADSLISKAIHLNAPSAELDEFRLPILSNRFFSNGFYLIRELKLKEKISSARFELDNGIDHIVKSISIHKKIDTLYESILSFSFLDQSKLAVLNSAENNTGNAISISLKGNEKAGNTDFLHDAFYFSSRSKGLALLDMLDVNRSMEEDTSTAVKMYSNVKDRMDQIQNQLIMQESESDSLVNELSIAQVQFSQLINKLKTENKSLSSHLSVQKIQEIIDDKTIFIDTYMDEDNLFLFYITKYDFSYSSTPSNNVIGKINTVTTALQNPTVHFPVEQSKLIYNTIFPSSCTIDFDLFSKLIIVPSKYIEGLPFEVLINEKGEYLIENFEVAYVYSSSLVLNQKKKAASKTNFVGFATNYSDNLKQRISKVGFSDVEVGPLLNAESELLSCKDIFDGDLFLDEQASLTNFKMHASDAKIVYVSLHSIVNKLDGSKSYFLFDDRNHEFVFHAFELNYRSWSTDLLILSACNTADGNSIQKEGVNSMSRAFLTAGVENIISSRWPATETSSTILLPSTLNKIKNGTSISSALQKSKLEYIRNVSPNLKHPFYWANFVLLTNDLKGEKLNFISDLKIWFYFFVGIVIILMLVFGYRRNWKDYTKI